MTRSSKEKYVKTTLKSKNKNLFTNQSSFIIVKTGPWQISYVAKFLIMDGGDK
jgi:hypothetical protein